MVWSCKKNVRVKNSCEDGVGGEKEDPDEELEEMYRLGEERSEITIRTVERCDKMERPR